MTYLIFIMLVIGCFIFSKSKLIYFSFVGYMWILFWGSYGHADYSIQESGYENILASRIGIEDPLWFIIRYLFSFLGVHYMTFLAISSFIAFLLVTKTIFDFTASVGYVLALYAISPLILDIVQYNNFIGMTICIFATRYLVKERLNIKKFFIVMTIAVGICSYMVLYFAFAIIPYISVRKLCIGVMSCCVAILTLPSAIYNIAVRFMRTEKISVYFNMKQKTATVVMLSLFIVIYISIIIISYYRNIKKTNAITKKYPYYSVAEMIMKINIFMIIVVPLQTYSLEAARFYRNIFILNYIFASYMSRMRGRKVTKNIIRIGVPLLAVLYSYIYTVHWNLETVLIPVFEYNKIFAYYK